MAKSFRPKSATEKEDNPLFEAVAALAGEVGLLRQTLDDLRDDFRWVTRNGLPIQSIEHVIVKRMALDPCADDWSNRLQLEYLSYDPRQLSLPAETVWIDQLASDLKSNAEAVAQGQLDVVITALDQVRTEILAALRRQRGDQLKDVSLGAADALSPRSPSVSAPSSGLESQSSTPPGCLF